MYFLYIVDQGLNNGLHNLDFTLSKGATSLSTQPTNNELLNLAKPKSFPNDPLEVLKNLDTTKMSSTIMNNSKGQLTPQAKETIAKFDDLTFMHSSVLMFPLHKIN